MPELPEVEITRRGLAAHLTGLTIADVVIRNGSLRWPIQKNLPKLLRGQKISSLKRRAKYLLMDCGSGHSRIATPDNEIHHARFPLPNPLPRAGEGANESLLEFHVTGTLILHLGMSGSLRILPANTPPDKHDHFDLVLGNGTLMRLRDPRRFGAVLWHEGNVYAHPLLASLGPEPLEETGRVGASPAREKNEPSHAGRAPTDDLPMFNARYLHEATRGRSASIKQCIMDSRIVVGVGNIYANEALFRAGIRPQLAAGKLSLPRCARLVEEIRATLAEAIKQGGSSLRDFVDTSGQPGYFQQNYWVYGRAGERCRRCGATIKQTRQGQRSSFYCGHCQR